MLQTLERRRKYIGAILPDKHTVSVECWTLPKVVLEPSQTPTTELFLQNWVLNTPPLPSSFFKKVFFYQKS